MRWPNARCSTGRRRCSSAAAVAGSRVSLSTKMSVCVHATCSISDLRHHLGGGEDGVRVLVVDRGTARRCGWRPFRPVRRGEDGGRTTQQADHAAQHAGPAGQGQEQQVGEQQRPAARHPQLARRTPAVSAAREPGAGTTGSTRHRQHEAQPADQPRMPTSLRHRPGSADTLEVLPHGAFGHGGGSADTSCRPRCRRHLQRPGWVLGQRVFTPTLCRRHGRIASRGTEGNGCAQAAARYARSPTGRPRNRSAGLPPPSWMAKLRSAVANCSAPPNWKPIWLA